MFPRVTVVDGLANQWDKAKELLSTQAVQRTRGLRGCCASCWLGDPKTGRVVAVARVRPTWSAPALGVRLVAGPTMGVVVESQTDARSTSGLAYWTAACQSGRPASWDKSSLRVSWGCDGRWPPPRPQG
jgi:hypothetical protein